MDDQNPDPGPHTCEDTNATYYCDHCDKQMPSDWDPWAGVTSDDA